MATLPCDSHVDYYKPKEGEVAPTKEITKQAVVNAILDKHDAATGGRRFNAVLATASINEAIHYFELFESIQLGRQMLNPDFVPLRVAAVFSPPADVARMSASCRKTSQEQADNAIDPDGKKQALSRIIARYNQQFGTNHRIEEFDQYYQDVQKHIKDHQFPNHDLPRKGRRRSISRSWWTCFSPALTPSISTRCTSTRTSSTTGSFRPSAAPTACLMPPSPTATSSTSAGSRTRWTRPSSSSLA